MDHIKDIIEQPRPKHGWGVTQGRVLSWVVGRCRIPAEKRVSPNAAYEIISNQSFSLNMRLIEAIRETVCRSAGKPGRG